MRRALPLLLLAACLDPEVADDVQPTDAILPAGSAVPWLHDDPALRAKLEAHMGLPLAVPLHSGFADGKPVRFWNGGAATEVPAPAFSLRKRDADGNLQRVSHAPIIDKIPGDPGYSPYWAIFTVEVTAKYNGEILASVEALNQARTAGLVLGPVLTGTNANWPIVTPEVTYETDDGVAASPTAFAFYRGKQVYYLGWGATPLSDDKAHVPITDVYVIRREGSEVLSEPDRHVDIDGDGDVRDTNHVFARAGWSPLCRVVEVTVAAGTSLIDTSGDQTDSAIRAASDLFLDGNAIAGRVLSVTPGTTLFNCPQRKP